MVQGTGTTGASTYVDAFDAYSAYKAKTAPKQEDEVATNTQAALKEDEAVISSQGAEAASKAGWSEETAKKVNDEYQKLQANIVQTMLKSAGLDGVQSVDWNTIYSNLPQGSDAMATEDLIAAMPEEWRPDATAERIVDFATAFYEKSGLSGEDFYNKIKDSIDQGFGGAKDELGSKLPGNIKSIMEQTRTAVYEKLDKWAENMGIEIPYTGEEK